MDTKPSTGPLGSGILSLLIAGLVAVQPNRHTNVSILGLLREECLY